MARVTPRISPIGSVLLRLETQVADPADGDPTAFLRATASLAPDQVLVARVTRPAVSLLSHETLVIVAVHRTEPESANARTLTAPYPTVAPGAVSGR